MTGIKSPVWLPPLPEGWSLGKLMGLVEEVKNSNSGMKSRNLLSLSYGNIIRKDIDSSEGLRPESYETYNVIDRHDIVLRLTDLQNDQVSLRSGLATEEGIITSAYVTVRPNQAQIEPRFLAYFLRFADLTKVIYALGSGLRASMSYSDLRGLPVGLPDRQQQSMIADFLDRETAEIDAFIADQERLVNLLTERRDATIANSLTVFEHPARPVALRRVLRPLSRLPFSGLGVITAYRDGEVTLRSNRRDEGYTFSDTEAGYQGVEPGDLVFHGLDGFAGAVGISDSQGNTSPVYHVCEAPGDNNVRFLALLLRHLGQAGFLTTQAPSVRQRSVDYRNWLTFGRLPLELPPRPDQDQAVRHIADVEARIVPLIEEARKAIALSKERRSALVSAAVTGQIDVTGTRH
jgi:type I restriction enzyme S subunit